MNSLNEPRVAPLATYTLTINISPKKRLFNYGRNYFTWANYDFNQQCDQIVQLIDRAQKELSLDDYFVSDYNFEKTIAGHCHLHAVINCNDTEKILLFQNYIHKKVGMPSLDPGIVCNIERIQNNDAWQEYIYKQAPHDSPRDSPNYIPTKSLFY